MHPTQLSIRLYRNIFLIAIFAGITIPATAASGDPENQPAWKSVAETKDDSRVDLKLNNQPIEMAVSILSDALKRTILVGDNLRQRPVSVYFQNVPVEDAMKAFCTAQLLVPIERNGCIVLVARSEYLSNYAPTRIETIKNADPAMLAGVLGDLIQKSELIQVTYDDRTRNLILRGDPEQIEKFSKTASTLDKALRREVFPVRYASVNNIAQTLQDTLYPNSSGQRAGGSSGNGGGGRAGYGSVIVDERSNQVIVCEIPENIECCRSIIQKLDIPIQTKVFSTGNIDPKVVADQIKKGELGGSTNEAAGSKTTGQTSSSGSGFRRVNSEATVQVVEGTNQIMVTDTPERLEILDKVMRELNRNIETIVIQPKNGLPTDLSEVIKGAYANLTVAVDMRSNSIVLTGHHDRVEQAADLIHKLDSQKNIKVEIESKIMIVSTSKLNDLGVRYFGQDLNGLNESLMNLNMNSNFPADSVKPRGAQMGSAPGSTLENPTKHTSNFLEALQPNVQMQAIVKALESDADTQMLANPRLQMLAGQTSTFFSGSKEPYSETTLQNDTSVQNVKFIDVGVKFEVTPLVRPDYGMTIDANTEFSYMSELRNGVPVVDTRTAHSIIEAGPGETILLGGLISKEDSRDHSGVPLLSRIPGVKYLFGSKRRSHVDREMVISITPRILKSDYVFTASDYNNIRRSFEMPADPSNSTTKTGTARTVPPISGKPIKPSVTLPAPVPEKKP